MSSPPSRPSAPSDVTRVVHPGVRLVGIVLFPGSRGTVVLNGDASVGAARAAQRSPDRVLALFGGAHGAGACDVGTLARIAELSEGHVGGWRGELEGIARIRRLSCEGHHPFWKVAVEPLPDPDEDATLVQGLSDAIKDAMRQLEMLFPHCWHIQESAARMREGCSPSHVCGALHPVILRMSFIERQRLLEELCLAARLETVLIRLRDRLSVIDERMRPLVN